MELNIQILGLNELIKKLGKATAQETLEQPMFQGALLLQRWSMKNRLTGPRPKYLGVVTNRLRSSLAVSRAITKDEFKFFIGTNVEYAPIHELGLTVDKVSSRGKSFQVKYPKRSFLQPAIENKENINDIVTLVNKSISKALEVK